MSNLTTVELEIVHVFRVWIDELGKDRMSMTTSREGFKLLSGARAWLEPTNESSQIVIFSVPRYPTGKRKAHW